MVLIDTHTHLFSEAFIEDRTEIIERAIASGVSTLLLPNIDADSIGPMHDLCQQYPKNCFPMIGLHPGSVKEDWEQQLEIIRKWLFSEKYIAVGEIGMDLYWDKTFQDAQAQAFRQQISWAKELKLPIIIHAREAFEEIFDIVDELNDDNLRGIFHCFTGTLEQARKIQEYGGFMLGLGGVLTYKKSGLDEVVKDIPIDMIVLETDSPYLPPTPHRGKRNESAYLIHIAEKLAEIKQMKLTEVADLTTANARQMFNLN